MSAGHVSILTGHATGRDDIDTGNVIGYIKFQSSPGHATGRDLR